MNLYIFNEPSPAAVYGIGTYIKELTTALKDSDINVCVVHLRSEKPDDKTTESDDIHHLYFPSPINLNASSNWDRQNELYYRNIVFLLRLQIKNTENLVFHLNYNLCETLVEELKKVFDCTIITVAHYSEWGLAVYDNLPRLRSILKEEHPDDFSKKLKKLFERNLLFERSMNQLLSQN